MLTQLETLKAMGIEVWALRESGAVLPESAPEPEMPAPVKQRATKENDQVSIPDGELAIPRFRLAMLHYGSVGFCLSLAEGAELPRRFCDDVARVMAADMQALKFQIVEWPMLDTSGIDQSVDAARQVITQKFGVLPPKVIVVGADVAEYFGPLEKVSDDAPVLVGGQSYLLVPSLIELLKSADKKRHLMILLANWQ